MPAEVIVMDMDNIDKHEVCPWRRRDTLPSAPFFITVVNVLLTVVISAVAPIGSILTLFLFAAAASIPFAVALLSSRSPFVFAAIPLSFAAALIICADVGGALLSLLYVPLALISAAMLYGDASRFKSAAAYTCVSAVIKVIVFSAALILTYGSLKNGADACMADLEASVSMTLDKLKESGAYVGIAFPEGFASELARAAVSLLPGILLLISELGAGIALSLIWRYLVKLKIAPAFRKDGWVLEVSRHFGFIFAGAYIASVLFSFMSSTEMLGFAATNITMICMPPIFVEGIRSFTARSSSRAGSIRAIIIAVLVVSLLFMPTLLLIAVAVICLRGTLAVIAKRSSADPKNVGDDGGYGPFDGDGNGDY